MGSRFSLIAFATAGMQRSTSWSMVEMPSSPAIWRQNDSEVVSSVRLLKSVTIEYGLLFAVILI